MYICSISFFSALWVIKYLYILMWANNLTKIYMYMHNGLVIWPENNQGKIQQYTLNTGNSQFNRCNYNCMQNCPPLRKLTQVPMNFDITILFNLMSQLKCGFCLTSKRLFGSDLRSFGDKIQLISKTVNTLMQ